MDGRLRVRSAGAGPRSPSSCPRTGTAREAAAAAARRPPLVLALGGCNAGDDDSAQRRRAGHHHARPGGQGRRAEGRLRAGADLRPARAGRRDRALAFDGGTACSRTAARAGRAPASCSTARATSRPTPTWSRPATASAPSEVFVEFSDGNRVPAEIVGRDPNADVALLKVDPEGLSLTPLRLGRLREHHRRLPGRGHRQPFRRAPVAVDRRVSAVDRNIESLTKFGSATRSRLTPRSTRATRAGRCSTPAAVCWASTPRSILSPGAARAWASRSRSTRFALAARAARRGPGRVRLPGRDDADALSAARRPVESTCETAR